VSSQGSRSSAGPRDPATYATAAWLFLRLLGVIYFIAFWSLAVQVVGLVGHDGILPARLYMDGARAFVASEGIGVDRYRLLPTLGWISTSDAFLRACCYAGAALSILLVVGVAPVALLALVWFDYLSLSILCRAFLSYQWDALLLEAGLIAVFLAPPVWRERLVDRADPPRVVRWLMTWLLFRLMVGSGAVKLASGDPTWRGLTALTLHYETQPIPTPLAWYAHQLPIWFQQVSTAGVLAIELIAPWFALGPRGLRVVAFTLLAGLQLLIALTGNYAFFNVLSVALCVFLLDDRAFDRVFRRGATLSDEPPRTRSPERLALRTMAVWLFAVLTVPVSLMFFTGSIGLGLPLPLAGQIADVIQPFRSVNSYGLFAVMTTTRDEIVVEGSNDGERWEPYAFLFKPGDVNRRPPWVAPHQPRLDWQMWFASLASYADTPWFHNFCLRLLEGSPDVLTLMARNPFPDGPPKYVRGVLYRYHFGKTTWWTREQIGDYSPVMSR
jgi:hypothetical protein